MLSFLPALAVLGSNCAMDSPLGPRRRTNRQSRKDEDEELELDNTEKGKGGYLSHGTQLFAASE